MDRKAFDTLVAKAAIMLVERFPELLTTEDLRSVKGTDNLPRRVTAACHRFKNIVVGTEFYVEVAYDAMEGSPYPGWEQYDLLATIAHELIHVAVYDDSHRGRFITRAKAMGLCRYQNKWTASGFTQDFIWNTKHIIKALGLPPGMPKKKGA